MQQFFFSTKDNVTIEIVARLNDGDTIGDFRQQLTSGESFYGHSFEELLSKQFGTIEIDKSGKTVSQDPFADEDETEE